MLTLRGIKLRSVFLFCVFVTTLSVLPVQAGGFRQVGEELVEAAIMEVDAVVDVQQVSVGSGVVVEVIYGYELLGNKITKGSDIIIENLPKYKVPLFDTSGIDAKFVSHAKQTSEQKKHRGLYFLQSKMKRSVEHYVDLDTTTLDEQSGSKTTFNFRPRVVLGENGYGWWSPVRYSIEDSYRWRNAKWPAFGIVENLTRGVMRQKRVFRMSNTHRKKLETPTTARRYRTRRYVLSDNADTWEELLVRTRKAAEVRTKFDFAKSNLSEDERIKFYFSMLSEEKVYANYALEELHNIGGSQIAATLKSSMASLKHYSDDVLLAVMTILFASETTSAIEGLNGFVEVVERFSRKECLDPDSFKGVIGRLGKPLEYLVFGLIDIKTVMPLLVRLYDAELRCFLIQHDVDIEKFKVSDFPEVSYEQFLHKPENSGLTLDEAGMLGTVHYSKVTHLRKQQKELLDFKPVYTWRTLENMSFLPTGLAELLEFCGYGTENYDTVAMPDLTRPHYVIWKFSCDLLSEFNWPGKECIINDNRLLEMIYAYRGLLVEAIAVAIENDDSGLMHFAVDVLTRERTNSNASLIASLVSSTSALYEKPVRKEFLSRLREIPYFSIASALSSEYSLAKGEHRKFIDALLMEITRAEPPMGTIRMGGSSSGYGRQWKAYLRRLRDGRDNDEFELFSKDTLTHILHKKTCEDVNWGWNQRWKDAQIP